MAAANVMMRMMASPVMPLWISSMLANMSVMNRATNRGLIDGFGIGMPSSFADLGRSNVCGAFTGPPGGPVNAPHTDEPPKSAKELGIPMPNPSIKPLFAALFMTLMFASMLPIHMGKTPLAIAGVITFAILMTLTLYSWLLTPLEDPH